MKPLLWIIVTGLLLASVSVAESPSEVKQDEPLKHVGKAAELSTQLGAVDSLGVVPGGLTPAPSGDTRRSHLESSVFRRESPVEYLSEGRRDPFHALIVDEKKRGDEEIETDLLQISGAVLTGVVWANGYYLALVRDNDDRNFFLHEGDPIYQGRVTLVTQSQATFEISDFGDYQKVVLKVRAKTDRDKDKVKGNKGQS